MGSRGHRQSSHPCQGRGGIYKRQPSPLARLQAKICLHAHRVQKHSHLEEHSWPPPAPKQPSWPTVIRWSSGHWASTRPSQMRSPVAERTPAQFWSAWRCCPPSFGLFQGAAAATRGAGVGESCAFSGAAPPSRAPAMENAETSPSSARGGGDAGRSHLLETPGGQKDAWGWGGWGGDP